MKKLAMLMTGAALSIAAAIPAQAATSANVGFVSDYYFRGANLGDGGVYAGVDYEAGGFFAGTWWIDDATGGNDGLENDWYLGYGGEAGQFSWGVGYTNYQYTYTKDYEHEVFGSLGIAGFSAEVVVGSDEDDGVDGEGYKVYSIGYEAGAFSATLGHFEYDDIEDQDYEWVELSYSGTIVEGIDASVTFGKQFLGDTDTDGYMILDISKSFDL